MHAWTLIFFIALQALPAAKSLRAQENAKAPGNSPFDTLLHAKLWPEIPEPEDFVKKSRPPEGSLQYEPLTKQGQDPVRPKPKSAKELDEMASELEHARDANAAKARFKPFKPKPPAQSSRNPAPQ